MIESEILVAVGYMNMKREVDNFIHKKHLKREDIVSVSYSISHVQGAGIQHAALVLYENKKEEWEE